MTVLLTPSYDEIHTATVQAAASIPKPDVIIGVSRGGLLPAIILSHVFDCPMFPIAFSSARGMGETKNHDEGWSGLTANLQRLTPSKVLIVDDIADSGHTLAELKAATDSLLSIIHQDHSIDTGRTSTFVLHYKVGSVHVPSHCCWQIPADSDWVVYPFEKELIFV